MCFCWLWYYLSRLILITAIIWSALKTNCYVDHVVFCIKVMCLFWPGRYLMISITSNCYIHFFWKLRFHFCSYRGWLSFLRFVTAKNLKIDISYCATGDTLAEINCALSSCEICKCCTLLVTTYFVFLVVDRSTDEPMVWTAGTVMHLSFYVESKHVLYFKLGCPGGQPSMSS